jgi:hypothetical protein
MRTPAPIVAPEFQTEDREFTGLYLLRRIKSAKPARIQTWRFAYPLWKRGFRWLLIVLDEEGRDCGA